MQPHLHDASEFINSWPPSSIIFPGFTLLRICSIVLYIAISFLILPNTFFVVFIFSVRKTEVADETAFFSFFLTISSLSPSLLTLSCCLFFITSSPLRPKILRSLFLSERCLGASPFVSSLLLFILFWRFESKNSKLLDFADLLLGPSYSSPPPPPTSCPSSAPTSSSSERLRSSTRVFVGGRSSSSSLQTSSLLRHLSNYWSSNPKVAPSVVKKVHFVEK